MPLALLLWMAHRRVEFSLHKSCRRRRRLLRQALGKRVGSEELERSLKGVTGLD